MAVFQSNSEAAIIDRSQMVITNSENQSEIARLLAEYGYDSSAFAIGKSLLNMAKKASDDSRIETNEKSIAYDAFTTLKKELEYDYALLRKKAKVIFRNDPLILRQLAIVGEIPRVYVSWLNVVRTYCKFALSDESILSQMTRLKVTEELLGATLTKCDQVDELRAGYLKEKGESQNSTKLKDQAFAELEDWMREFYAVAKIALDDKTQLLEALGVYVKS